MVPTSQTYLDLTKQSKDLRETINRLEQQKEVADRLVTEANVHFISIQNNTVVLKEMIEVLEKQITEREQETIHSVETHRLVIRECDELVRKYLMTLGVMAQRIIEAGQSLEKLQAHEQRIHKEILAEEVRMAEVRRDLDVYRSRLEKRYKNLPEKIII